MRPEEYLDYLITHNKDDANQPFLLDSDVASSLGAAELLTRMRDIPVPSEFASRLEEKVRAHACARRLEENGKLMVPVHIQRSPSSDHLLRRRPWIVAIGAVAVILIVFASLLTVSFQNLPGNSASSFGQKQGQLAPMPTNDAQSQAEKDIEQLESALVNLNTVVTEQGHDDEAVQEAFDLVASWTQKSQTSVASLPSDSRFQVTRQHLASKLTEEKQTLFRLLDGVGWSIKILFTHQLDALGVAVPLVSHVTVQTLKDGVLKITLRGKNFSSQGQFVIDGKHIESLCQITSDQLVVVLNNTWWEHTTHTIGILNPDGTAAQATYHSNDDGHERSGTPVATPTRRPDD